MKNDAENYDDYERARNERIVQEAMRETERINLEVQSQAWAERAKRPPDPPPHMMNIKVAQ
jgi:hypothetical protein